MSAVYEDDFHAWALDQEQALRTRGRSNAIDYDHVAEEIGDLGRSDRKTVLSNLRQMFKHLAKILAEPDSPAVQHWRAEAVNFWALAQDYYEPSMARHIELATVYVRALKEAAQEVGPSAVDRSRNECPFALDRLMRGEVEVDWALAEQSAGRPMGEAQA